VTRDEIDAFLRADPPWVAAVATLDETGAPHVVSAWYRWDGEAFHFWSLSQLRWPNHLQRDPRVAVVVFEHVSPLRAVYAKGRADVTVGPLDELMERIRPIVARYDSDPEETIAGYEAPSHVVVTVVPDTLVGKVNG
jgi:nitroimidazol reductase NimA-like FMN-containing flavoprotein (pyridoxamine 5'-phosphate oxidase superfamily)